MSDENVRSFPDAVDGTPPGTQSERDDQAGNDEELTREQQIRGQSREDLIALGREVLDEISDLKDDRKLANDAMAAARAKMVTKGIPKAALALIEKVRNMEDDELDGFWLAVDILSESIGRPLKAQLDMFEQQDDAA